MSARKICFLLLILFGLAMPSFAQLSTGSISGTVQDVQAALLDPFRQSDVGLVPLRQPCVEDPVHDDVCHRLVVRMDSRPFGSEYVARSMASDQARDLETGLNRVLNQSVRELEGQPRHTQNSGRLGGLNLTGSPAPVPRRFTVTQVDEERRQPLV